MQLEQTWERGEFVVSTVKTQLDPEVIHAFLNSTYWAAGIPWETVVRSLENSLTFGLFHGTRQVGMARVITDYATFAYLADVVVLEEYRGQGLGTFMMECVVAHPDLQGLRRFLLFTRDAHQLYKKVGFEATKMPERIMERNNADAWGKKQR
jgi:GNAT superfamily N-acetyltransferase